MEGDVVFGFASMPYVSSIVIVVGFGFTRSTAHVNPMVGAVTFGFAGSAAYMRNMVVVVVFEVRLV